ncbi:MAG TPA: NTP transferase domain-containing protein [Desulfopila sp.]|nr:NTP transferase domain-containing protein [Desulfopila sp.]
MNIAAVILAAGSSSRMRDNFKPLMRLGETSLLGRCAVLFRQADIDAVMVVTGHRNDEVEDEACLHDLRCLYNTEYRLGMYSSVRTAASALARYDGFFLLPVDIPLVRPATLAAQLSAFDGRSVILPTFKGKRGHPALIPSRLIPAILESSGRGGLRKVLDYEKVHTVPVWDRGILFDCDTLEDYADLQLRQARMTIGEPVEAAVLAALTMPVRTLAHCRAVAGTAVAMARELKHHGSCIDAALTHNAALLHDIAKGQPHHEMRGAEIVRELGLDALAEPIRFHRDLPPPATGRLGVKEVVCLADKLVHGNARVTIRDRFSYKLNLYTRDDQACAAIHKRMANALALQEIFERTTGSGLETVLSLETTS